MAANETVIYGSIIDSWVERAHGDGDGDGLRLILQVAPRGCQGDIWIVEAAPSLAPDEYWLADLGENLCHGNPVAAVGYLDELGHLNASRLQLEL